MTPEQVVEAYLQASLNMKDVSQRDVLLDLTTGNLHDVIRQAPDELVRNAFIEKNYQLEKYSVVERRDRTPRETEVTFLLEYLNLGPNRDVKAGDAPRVKTENTVVVLKEKGLWVISDVLGKKTSIDFQFEEVISPNMKLEPQVEDEDSEAEGEAVSPPLPDTVP